MKLILKSKLELKLMFFSVELLEKPKYKKPLK